MSVAMKASASPRRSRCCSTMSRRCATSSALALAAASRTMPRSKKMRALFRCSSESWDDGEHDLGCDIHLPEDRLGRELQHLGALAMRDGDQPHAAQRLHGFADRRAADAEALHQFALGRHVVARLQLAAGDHPLQPHKDLVGQLAADDRFRMAHGEFHLATGTDQYSGTVPRANVLTASDPRVSSQFLLVNPAYSLYQYRERMEPQVPHDTKAHRAMIILTYRIETPGSIEALAAKIASDQSTGTFVALPGETEELKARVAARVLAIRPLAPMRQSRPFPSLPVSRALSTAPMSTSPFRSTPSAPICRR